MKKVIFMALAAVFMLSSGFESVSKMSNSSSNEIDLLAYQCSYNIVITHSDYWGNETQVIRPYSLETEDAAACDRHAQSVLALTQFGLEHGYDNGW